MKNEIIIQLGHHYKEFVQKKIDTGKYLTEGEVIRSALRFFEKEERLEMLWASTMGHSWLHEDDDDFDAKAHMEQILREIDLNSQDEDQ